MIGEEQYMESFHNTLSKHFLESVSLIIKKQNRGRLVGHVWATITLNSTISGGEWDHDRMVSELDLWPEVCEQGRSAPRG